MIWSWFDAPWLERARQWIWAIADRVAFVLESALVANGVVWFLTWTMLHFSWRTATREWGSFWTHYARASAQARQPVEIALVIVAVVFSAAAAAIRFPKARLGWAPWPRRARLRSPATSREELAA